MHDELERTTESPAISSARIADAARLEMLDVVSAIALAEKTIGSRVFGGATENGELGHAIAEASALSAKGERAALVAPIERLASTRDSLRRAAAARVALVAHAIAGHGAEDIAALADLGWGVLSAAGPADSLDLSFIARRASEDSRVPFIVVHGLGRPRHAAGRAVAMVGVPQNRAIEAFVGGSAQARSKDDGARAAAGDRAFAERVPFALGAAFREYGSVTGRRHDAFDKIPLGESSLVLVGAGPVGDALLYTVGELRARGYDVGGVRLTSIRPFPAPRLVKALSRSLAITVLSPTDEPLAPGSFLARDVKAAFTDALTWAPGFPGIGRIPKLFVGATGPSFDVADLAAVCDNMLADERGRRTFSFVDVEQMLPRPSRVSETSTERSEREIAVRFVLDDAAAAETVLNVLGSALASGVGFRVHAVLTESAGALGVELDVVASRDRARGGMLRRVSRLVVATERGVASAGAVASLPEGAILGVLGADPNAPLPEGARTAVRERRARVLHLDVGATPARTSMVAAVSAGAALALASQASRLPLDADGVARVVSESISEADAAAHGVAARQAYEATRAVLAARVASEPEAHRPIGVG